MNDRDMNDDLSDAMPDSVASAVAGLAPASLASPDEVARVMGAVRRRRAATRFHRWSVTAGAIAATLLLSLVVTRSVANGPASRPPSVIGRPAVQFELRAPDAQRLALVGDFNAWDAHATPMTRDPATGAWVASIALAEGRYLYAYVADGNRWLPDPRAPLASGDDFARPNSVLVVNTQLSSAAIR
jgi:hypothetical protein